LKHEKGINGRGRKTVKSEHWEEDRRLKDANHKRLHRLHRGTYISGYFAAAGDFSS
jgi:hypothetical protein